MKAMILAAGRGERMGALTAPHRNRCLALAMCRLIEHHVVALAASGIDEIVINLSYRGNRFASSSASGDRFGVAIHFSEEGEPPLETAGGIVHALPLLGTSRSCSSTRTCSRISTYGLGRGRASRRSCWCRIPITTRAVTSASMRRARQRCAPLSPMPASPYSSRKVVRGADAGPAAAEAVARRGDRAARAARESLLRDMARRRYAGAAGSRARDRFARS